jgi:murein DD-endopeptidase MepM/ murein hydrolase activator NlpD
MMILGERKRMNNEFREDRPKAPMEETKVAKEVSPKPEREHSFVSRWMETLLHLGLGESLLRFSTNFFLLVVVVLTVWLMQKFYRQIPLGLEANSALAAGTTPTPVASVYPLPPQQDAIFFGITRLALLHTNIPSRPRTDIVTYTVQKGDTVTGIAEKYGLQPKTIFAANYEILQDDPHNLMPNQELKILPVDGVLWQWLGGIPFGQWAGYFQVQPEDIINYPPNHLNIETIGDPQNANIETGTFLIIPGGYYQYHTPGQVPLGITRSNPASAQVAGDGSCGPVEGGAVGTGTFVYPTDRHYLSGFDYSTKTNHLGIDLAADEGNNIYATDGGVVVYAGWNSYGYGNMVMIDHGTGFQSLYAHLSQIWVSCGMSVSQGQNIAAAGATGHASGPHLHFEIRTSSTVINPWDVMPAP